MSDEQQSLRVAGLEFTLEREEHVGEVVRRGLDAAELLKQLSGAAIRASAACVAQEVVTK
jgi:hypothetical protein